MGRVGGIGTQELAEQSVVTSKLADGSVTLVKLAALEKRAEADSSQVGTNLGPLVAATGYVDMPGASVAFTPNDITRKVKATLTFSGYVDTAVGNALSVQLLIDGVQTGLILLIFYNAIAQHQGWSFQWAFAAGVIPAGAHTVKCQVKVNAGTTRFIMDVNDNATFVVEEVN